MKSTMALLGFLALTSVAHAVSPVSKVFEMLGGLEAKIIKEGEEAQKTFDEFTEWCEDRSRNVGFEIKTGKAEIEDLSAAIEKETSKASALNTKIEELSGDIAKDESDLKDAEKVRASEVADFEAESKELKEVISTLERAVAVLSRELAKGSSALIQFKNTGDMAKALAAMVQASMISTADFSRLTALVQTKQDSEDEDPGAPAAAVYENHSGGIVETLEDLLDKANAQLESAQKAETTARHNYAMLKQSLDDEVEYANKDMAAAKDGLAASQEAKATAEGDLSVTQADLKEDEETLSTLHQDCMQGADEFKEEQKSRGDELTALAGAKKVLKESLGAAAQTYGAALDQQLSFLQRSQLSTGVDLAKFEAIRFIRDLARKEQSTELAQLASKMSSAFKFAQGQGADPFAKVKGMISEMITKLEKDGAAEATQKAYCDKETAETKQKKMEKEYEISKMTTKIDSMTAKSAKLTEQVAELQKELAELAKSQADMNSIRADEKGLYEKNSAEMKQGIDAVKQALTVLKDYYASDASHDAAKGAGEGIISMLEVVESDFTKGLADMEVTESMADKEYEKVTYMNKIATTSKTQDVKYKTKEAASLDKSTAEVSSDREGVQSELDALLEYLAKLNKMCIAKAEPYAERAARRKAEIAGLKQALQILDGESVLLQEQSKRKLRGA
jgi:predicted  nucleic acid-binding Zn-ribbon protein